MYVLGHCSQGLDQFPNLESISLYTQHIFLRLENMMGVCVNSLLPQ